MCLKVRVKHFLILETDLYYTNHPDSVYAFKKDSLMQLTF